MPTAIVTGASRGLGLALARALSERGWRLVIDARVSGPLHEAAAELPNTVAIPGDVTDPEHRAALIAAAQAVEHYEITRYGSLIAWAKQLGKEDEAVVLAETLAEEKETDETLSTLAERKINLRSAA